MLVVVPQHQRAAAQRLGRLGSQRDAGHRRVRRVNEVIRHVQRRVAESLDLARLLLPLARRRRSAGLYSEAEPAIARHHVPTNLATAGANCSIASTPTTT